MTKPIEEQREIIICFLLLKDDSEIQYFAYLLYDLINNESYLLKTQPLANQLYDSLHWSVQKIFKNTPRTAGGPGGRGRKKSKISFFS